MVWRALGPSWERRGIDVCRVWGGCPSLQSPLLSSPFSSFPSPFLFTLSPASSFFTQPLPPPGHFEARSDLNHNLPSPSPAVLQGGRLSCCPVPWRRAWRVPEVSPNEFGTGGEVGSPAGPGNSYPGGSGGCSYLLRVEEMEPVEWGKGPVNLGGCRVMGCTGTPT